MSEPTTVTTAEASRFPEEHERLFVVLQGGLPELVLDGRPVPVGAVIWLHRSAAWHRAA